MQVSTREFQLNQKEYLDKVSAGEKIILTNRGIPVAEVHKVGEETKEQEVNEDQIRLVVRMVIEELGATKEKEIYSGTMPVENIDEKVALSDYEESKPIDMWCQLHFEAGVTYPCRKITYEDENGTELIKEKLACPKCIDSYEKRGVGRVYYL